EVTRPRARGRDAPARPVPAADRAAPAARPVGDARRVPLDARAGRGARLRLRGRRGAGALALPRRRAAAGRGGTFAGDGPVSVPEAPLERTDHGLRAAGEGWFVINAREAEWI